jgi:hypothetical protein
MAATQDLPHDWSEQRRDLGFPERLNGCEKIRMWSEETGPERHNGDLRPPNDIQRCRFRN